MSDSIDNDELLQEVLASLDASLQLGDRINRFSSDTQLLGSLPELDSMAVVTVITGLEERFGIVIDDDEVSADTFESVGTLMDLVRNKLE